MLKKEELPSEHQLILSSAIEIHEKDKEQFKDTLGKKLDWTKLLYQMTIHRTLNMFYFNIKKFNLTSMLENEVKRLLDAHWIYIEKRNLFYREKLVEVYREFEKDEIAAAILKGNMLVYFVYPALPIRSFNDLDLLISTDKVNLITRALLNLEYKQGYYNTEKNCIIEATRKEILLQQMASHELQEFLKVSDNPYADLIQVDVNHDILWKGNCPYKVDTKDLINRAIPVTIDNTKVYMLDYIDNIIQLSAHLYKEATLMLWITDLRDLKIYKFTDLYIFIQKFSGKINWNDFIERVRAYKIEKIIYYNFYYIQRMFGDFVPAYVMEALQPGDLAYLDEYGIENKEPGRWECDFFERLFDTDRILEIEEEKCGNMQKFLKGKEEADGVFNRRTIKMN